MLFPSVLPEGLLPKSAKNSQFQQKAEKRVPGAFLISILVEM
jgi:hypothetical protein